MIITSLRMERLTNSQPALGTSINCRKEGIMETIIIEKNKYDPEKFDQMEWTLKARSKDSTRFSIQGVCITPKRVIATDGWRLHTFKSTDHPAGIYSLVSQNKKSIVLQKTEETNYPDIKAVFPKRYDKRISIQHHSKDVGGSYTQIIRAIPEHLGVNKNYVDDCLTEGQWKIGILNNGGPIRLRNCNKMAIIMPMKA
jgi:hypothetical protein